MQKTRAIALAVAAISILIGLIVRFYHTNPTKSLYEDRGEPMVGDVGSEHNHMSILVFVEGIPVDFSLEQYQNKDPRVHFEDDNGTFIHKHATGVTLNYFFNTLGIRLTNSCIALDSTREYCENSEGKLRTYLNRKVFTDWARYVLREGDKILIDYSSSTEFEITLRLNAVPELMPDMSRD